jgi:hypothetical protein
VWSAIAYTCSVAAACISVADLGTFESLPCLSFALMHFDRTLRKACALGKSVVDNCHSAFGGADPASIYCRITAAASC